MKCIFIYIPVMIFLFCCWICTNPQDAEIKIEEAKGIAEAQRIINSTLTDNYLQHEAIQAQLKMASSPNHTTVYIPAGVNGIPLIKTML